MKTNDLKKDDMVVLRNGWGARIEDNKKGNIRVATVFGTYTEMGSVYAHDIVTYKKDGALTTIEHTDAQLALRKRVEGMGF